jgi:hypothetical protein
VVSVPAGGAWFVSIVVSVCSVSVPSVRVSVSAVPVSSDVVGGEVATVSAFSSSEPHPANASIRATAQTPTNDRLKHLRNLPMQARAVTDDDQKAMDTR